MDVEAEAEELPAAKEEAAEEQPKKIRRLKLQGFKKKSRAKRNHRNLLKSRLIRTCQDPVAEPAKEQADQPEEEPAKEQVKEQETEKTERNKRRTSCQKD